MFYLCFCFTVCGGGRLLKTFVLLFQLRKEDIIYSSLLCKEKKICEKHLINAAFLLPEILQLAILKLMFLLKMADGCTGQS